MGIGIDAVDYEEAVRQILNAAHEGSGLGVSALAVHGVMTGVQDPEHRYRLNDLELVVPDGQPVRWALRWLHHVRLPDRVYGPTLTLDVCRAAAEQDVPVYFYGSRPEVLEKLIPNVQSRFPNLQVAGVEPSQFRQLSEEENQEMITRIRQTGARIVFVGLGCPRQEIWTYENRRDLACPVLAVGAAFDFHAGTLPQAPAWMQRSGLEWLFRLSREPGRLWRRYLVLNPNYLVRILLQKLCGDPQEERGSTSPGTVYRFG